MANRVIKFDELQHYYEESYSYPSVNTPSQKFLEVDKSKSISEMTLDELRILINRLRDEREAEDIIRSLRRSAGQKETFENPAKIDTKTPIEQLYHSGVLKMRWGFRKYQNKDGTRTALGKRRDEQLKQEREKQRIEYERSEDYIKTRENKIKGPESLSNEELKKLNERLQLEATYRTLTTVKIEKAESFVGNALKTAAAGALTDFSKSIMLGAAKSIVKEISPSFAEAAGFGVKKVAAAIAAPQQAPQQAPAQQPKKEKKKK